MRNISYGFFNILFLLACASFFLVLLGIAIFASRNYMGICRDTGDVLDDRHKIDIAVKKTLIDYYSNEFGAYAVTNDKKMVKKIIPIRYSGLTDFYQINKGCCGFIKGNGGDYEWMPPGVLERLTGETSAVVDVDFLFFYVDIDGLKKSRRIESFVSVSNCGFARKIN